MLAVQQAPSRMGSSQPDSDPFLPFGFREANLLDPLDPNQDQPLFDAPEPAPGAPLLSETDSKFLSSFFEDITANQYNMPSFGEGLNFSDVWLDLPPRFMGTTTSFGPESAQSLGPELSPGFPNEHQDMQSMMARSQLMPPPPPPPPQQPSASYQQHPSDDVLSAAATLMQNGSGSRANKINDASAPRRPIGPPVGHLRHQPLEEFKEENRKGTMMQPEVENTFTEWMWGPTERRSSSQQSRLSNVDYQWGSDSNFGTSQGYTPEANKETVESMQQEQLKCLDCLEPSNSAATTRPGSPVNGQNGFPIIGNINMSEAKRPEDPDAPPRKRRKSKIQSDSAEEEDEDTSSKSSAIRRRKSRSERNGSISSPTREPGSAGKRRKSTTAAVKPPRENLTEEQKRENHIRSEQKRRTLIKEGFDDLCDIVPGLKGGGFSKSTMLAMTAEWLEEVLVGNKALSLQLAALEGR